MKIGFNHSNWSLNLHLINSYKIMSSEGSCSFISHRRTVLIFIKIHDKKLGGYLVGDKSIVLLLEPLDSVLSVDLVVTTDSSLASLSTSNTSTLAAHADVKVHTVNTNRRIVLDTKVNVLSDTETEVTGLREVLGLELVLLNLKTSLKNLLSLRTTNSNVNSDLFVSSNAESSTVYLALE